MLNPIFIPDYRITLFDFGDSQVFKSFFEKMMQSVQANFCEILACQANHDRSLQIVPVNKGFSEFVKNTLNKSAESDFIKKFDVLQNGMQRFFAEHEKLPPLLAAVPIKCRPHDLIESVSHFLETFRNFPLDKSPLSSTIGFFHLLSAILLYDVTANLHITYARDYKSTKADILKGIKSCHFSYQLADFSLSDCLMDHPMIANWKSQFQTKLGQLEAFYNPLYMSLAELQYHVHRKNEISRKNKESYFCEIIFNHNDHNLSYLNQTTFSMLLQKIAEIYQHKKISKTQIIFNMGQLHYSLLDIAWNNELKRLEIICIEPTTLVSQEMLLLALTKHLSLQCVEFKIIACQADLQKDKDSCATYCVALSGIVSKISFSVLEKSPKMSIPLFSGKLDDKEKSVPIKNVEWVSVTALGRKAVLMSQSDTNRDKLLSELFIKKPAKQKIEAVNHLQHYQLSAHQSKGVYIAHRRHSLHCQTLMEPFPDLSVEKIMQTVAAKDFSHCLRLLASGRGLSRWLKYLLTQATPEQLNEAGGEKQRTPLHWAYSGNQERRAKLLLAQGADDSLVDKDGKTPNQLVRP